MSWWVLLRGVSCNLGVCPQTYGTELLQHRWLREEEVRQVSKKATNYMNTNRWDKWPSFQVNAWKSYVEIILSAEVKHINVSICFLNRQGFLYNVMRMWHFVSDGVLVNVPTPSLRLCNSSVRGAVAPSASMASAASLSWASSHRTPAATRWMFSMGEYSSCKQILCFKYFLRLHKRIKNTTHKTVHFTF